MFMGIFKIFLWLSGLSMLFMMFIIIGSRKNEGTFKCDHCGERFKVSTNNYYVTKDEMLCKTCYGSTMAPYKVEPAYTEI